MIHAVAGGPSRAAWAMTDAAASDRSRSAAVAAGVVGVLAILGAGAWWNASEGLAWEAADSRRPSADRTRPSRGRDLGAGARQWHLDAASRGLEARGRLEATAIVLAVVQLGRLARVGIAPGYGSQPEPTGETPMGHFSLRAESRKWPQLDRPLRPGPLPA
jgi:predicted mannosyl-3-phosphoglycerate phosphatase (HAD superfamily)